MNAKYTAPRLEAASLETFTTDRRILGDADKSEEALGRDWRECGRFERVVRHKIKLGQTADAAESLERG